ncbi:DNA polymerase [Exiguobacterium antarcticum]|uniref:DNA polymerase n=1 Tax=Exiguobacterium antarcticum TaxID=132920 RepID=UPI00047C231C|nr:DNA polymerase [Exiguobacterium antarcticum]
MAKKKQQIEEKPLRLLTLDTETRGLFGEVFRVGLYDGETYYSGYTFPEIYPIIQDLSTRWECHVYVHNLDFDLAKIAKDFITNEMVLDLKKAVAINNQFIVLPSEHMILHDSLRILPMSLERITKSFGLDKEGKIDLSDYLKTTPYAVYKEDGTLDKRKSQGKYFENVDPDEPMLNEYLEMDCRSLHTVLTMIMEIAHMSLEDFVRCPTAASLSMSVYKAQQPDEYEDATSSNYYGATGEMMEEFVRRAYYGGRTEVFTPQLEDGYHYDVNSLYPHVMKENEFPIGYYEHIYDPEKARTNYRFWKKYRKGAGIAEANVTVPDMHIPPLPTRVEHGKLENKLLFPVGSFTGVWTYDELEKAEQLGCTVEVTQTTYWYKTAPVFKEFVGYWEDIKKNAEGAKREFSKLVQNSLYGKFGMRRERETLAPYAMRDELEDKDELFDTFYHTELDMRFLTHITKSKAKYIQPHIAVFVTSKARLLLLDGLLQQEKAGSVSYCDTDSIAGTAVMPDDMVHKDDYGKWKLENTIKQGIFLQPKLYAEIKGDGKTVIKGKGIPGEKLEDITFTNYEEWLHTMGAKKQDSIHLYDGYESRQKFVTLLKANKDFDSKVVLRKTINLLNEQKRVMDYVNNTSRPHNLDTYEEYSPSEVQEILAYTYLDDDVDQLKEFVKEIGHIRIPAQKTSRFRFEYEQMSRSVRIKYFRKEGRLDLDSFAEAIGWEVNELVEELRMS